ncbi:MAG: serine hydrolase domain-containing protein [Akkermansia sp.]
MNVFTSIRRAFDNNFETRDELGASVSIWQNGQEILSLNQGFTTKKSIGMAGVPQPWTRETLIPVFSATKGAAAATLLLTLHSLGLNPNMPIGDIWPFFPLPHSSLAELMSHQCGLASLEHPANLSDHEACVASIEQTKPAWLPPEHGYHPHTYGSILDEIMIRLTGEKVSSWWDTHIRTPLDLDFYITLPESEFHRVGMLYPGKADKESLESPFYQQYLKPGTPIFKAFHSLEGLGTVRLMNTAKAWTCGSPAFGGVASAQGMAKFYQACLGNISPDLFPPIVREWMRTVVIDGIDLTMLTPTAFSCGFMLDPINPANGQLLRHLFGQRGFGHAGAGGSHAFADPDTGISFAYTMNHMDLNVLPGEKTKCLVDALLTDIRG